MHTLKLKGHLGAVEDDEAGCAGRGGDGLPAGLGHQGAPDRGPVPGMAEHSAFHKSSAIVASILFALFFFEYCE